MSKVKQNRRTLLVQRCLGALVLLGGILHWVRESNTEARILLQLRQSVARPIVASLRSSNTTAQNISIYPTTNEAVKPVSKSTSKNITQVILWPYIRQETGPYFLRGWLGVSNTESKQIELDGIRESPHLQLLMNLDEISNQHKDQPVVWIGDIIGRFNGHGEDACEAFGQFLHKAQLDHYCQTGSSTQNWPVKIVDWADTHNHKRCQNIEYMMGASNVQYSKRARVEGRHWNPSTDWIEPGHSKVFFALEGRPYTQMPLSVRTDTVEALHYTLSTKYRTDTGARVELVDPIEQVLSRPYDVVCLWPLKNSTDYVGNPQEANFRFAVSQAVQEISTDHNLKHFVGLAGRVAQPGRWGVMLEYIQMLLDTKIVVVANRDRWEDHYRLMEALISGALVFTDKWVILPPGLRHGESIVEFNSPQNLEEQLLYYLNHTEKRQEIAATGRRVAMSQHRTWHRMEEIVFGHIRTKCPPKDPKCIYRVHVNESIPINCTETTQEFGTVLNCISWDLK